MIYTKVDILTYRDTFVQKFTNFAEKAPIVISFAVDENGVTVAHENSGEKYFYLWDYVVPVKSFIHDIKRELVKNHYPRISRVVKITRELTPKESNEYLLKGVKLEDVPKEITEEVTEIYRIDKILAMKDEFILVNERTNEQYCYHMNSSAFLYLRNYREGKFKDILEAGEVFFKKSNFISKLNKLAE